MKIKSFSVKLSETFSFVKQFDSRSWVCVQTMLLQYGKLSLMLNLRDNFVFLTAYRSRTSLYFFYHQIQLDLFCLKILISQYVFNEIFPAVVVTNALPV